MNKDKPVSLIGYSPPALYK